MKCHVPEISWHNRDPILSIDFQPSDGKCRRLATGGTDTHVLIWLVNICEKGSISLEFRADLTRHTKGVNIVRFSNSGEILASGDDEAFIILWKQQQQEQEAPDIFNEDVENKEHWLPFKTLRGHIDDVCDFCWSPDDLSIISGSIDNTCILWDVTKGKSSVTFSESKGFVQGVTWDPRSQYVANLSSDRALRIYSLKKRRVVFKVQKACVPPKKDCEPPAKPARIFYDDTLKSFCRRLSFSPDGELLVAPSGIIEQEDNKFTNAVYIFSRNCLNKPLLFIPTGNKPTLVVRFCPIIFKVRGKNKKLSEVSSLENKEDSQKLEVPKSSETELQAKPELQDSKDDITVEKPDSGAIKSEERKEKDESYIRLPYRMVFAVATQDSVLLYDTQQTLPFATVSNIHYARLSDLTWSPDAKILMASSTDGYCSFITFSDGELGEVYSEPLPFQSTSQEKG